MKKTSINGIVAMVAVAIAVVLTAQQEPKKSSPSHLGTWQLASFKYGTGQPDFTDYPPSQRRIKLITDTHFTWVDFDTTTKKVTSTAGGTYTLSGNTYTESIDFGRGMDTYLGQKHAFTIRVEDDTLLLSGSLADGLKIEEVWQRVK